MRQLPLSQSVALQSVPGRGSPQEAQTITPLQHERLSNQQTDKLIELRDGQPVKALPFTLFQDLGNEALPKRWIFKGAMARGETSAWIAPPGRLKSALLAEASICAAHGIDWHGKRNKERVGVVYSRSSVATSCCAGSRRTGDRMGLGALPIAVVGSTFNLMTPKTVPLLVATIPVSYTHLTLPTNREV